MSERKVLNKYYPPDFDPSKIPRMKLPKNRQYTVRLMAPFNMRCKTCGEYIYRGKKFNARKEDVEGEDYCGIRIYRFYIKCTRCLQEISFRTDPKSTDYEIEEGATRNFMALKLAQEQEQREEEELKEEEANNPMKLLETRTQQSKFEIEQMECLEELKDLNRRHHNIDFNAMLAKYNTKEVKEKIEQLQKEKDELTVQELMRKRKATEVEEVVESLSEDDEDESAAMEFINSVMRRVAHQPQQSSETCTSAESSSGPTQKREPVLTKEKQEESNVAKKPKLNALSMLCSYDSGSENSSDS